MMTNFTHEQYSRLSVLTLQASSLSYMVRGEQGEAMRLLNETTQDAVLWLLSDLLQEIDDIVNGGGDDD